jgi:hypothetical protein
LSAGKKANDEIATVYRQHKTPMKVIRKKTIKHRRAYINQFNRKPYAVLTVSSVRLVTSSHTVLHDTVTV